MSGWLASIFSPLKETTASRNGRALDRLEGDVATPIKKRGPPRRALNRKSVAFDMTPKAHVKHTPPRSGRQTPLTLERTAHINSRKRKASPIDNLEESKDVIEEAQTPVDARDEPSTQRQGPVANENDGPSGGGTTEHTGDEREFTFKEFIEHRWDQYDSMQIRVEWDNGERTWEPEAILHHDAPQTLLEYWEQVPGGRPDNPRRPGFYEIHAIRKHSNDRKRLFVEWVGYGPGERSWEPRNVVQDAAPEILSDYWDSLPRRKRRRAAK